MTNTAKIDEILDILKLNLAIDGKANVDDSIYGCETYGYRATFKTLDNTALYDSFDDLPATFVQVSDKPLTDGEIKEMAFETMLQRNNSTGCGLTLNTLLEQRCWLERKYWKPYCCIPLANTITELYMKLKLRKDNGLV